MKRKIENSKITPIKVPQSGGTLMPLGGLSVSELPSLGSPIYTPPSPLLGKPPALSPATERELRRSCAIILKEFKPSGYEFMERPKTGAVHVERRQMQTKSDKEKSKTEPQTPHTARHKMIGSDLLPRFMKISNNAETVEKPQEPAYQHVPATAASSFTSTTTVRKPSLIGRRASTDQARDCKKTSPPTGLSLARQASINAAQQVRPTTSAGAVESYNHSTSTTRTNTTFDQTFTHLSTAATTVASRTETPVDRASPTAEKKSSAEKKTSIDITNRANAKASAWMTRELSKRSVEIERPPSRGSRIANYLRPRTSSDSIRTTHSADVSSSSSSWWHGIVQPKSPANAKAAEPSENLDLNRALPPLPSLSTWDSQKPPKSPTGNGLHIAQLMRGPSPTTSEQKQQDRRVTNEKVRTGSVSSPLVSPRLAKELHKSTKSKDDRRKKEVEYAATVVLSEKQPNRVSERKVEPEDGAGGSGGTKMEVLKRQLSKLTLGGIRASRQRKEERKIHTRLVDQDGGEWEVRRLN